MEEYSKKNAIDNLSPRSAFKVGILVALAIVFAVGFFIMLGINIKDKDESGSNGSGSGKILNINDNSGNDSGIKIATVDTKNDWIRGDKNAKVTIIEFSDIDCPYCQRFHDTMKQVMANYGDDVNWVYRHFPLPSLHPEAPKKAEAVECVGEQGGNDKVWELLDIIYSAKPALNQYATTVSQLGLDVDKFQECLDSGKYTSKVQQHAKQAQDAGARGTPYSIIVAGDTTTPIPGALPYDSIKSQLDNILQ